MENKAYYGYFRNRNELLMSSSGGAINALSHSIIERGGIVFGAAYSSDFKSVEYKSVEKIDDLNSIRGTKYSFPTLSDVYNKVALHLSNDRTVLFIGVGCVVGGLFNFLLNKKINTSKLYTIDILCHGAAPSFVQRSFVDDLEKRYKAKIKYINMRYKKIGWFPFFMDVKFDNGKRLLKQFDQTDYGKAFKYVAQPSCTDCKFKGSNHMGDICCGDYWGMSKKTENYNQDGVSLMIVQTPKGKELMSWINDNAFFLAAADLKFALDNNPMYSRSRKSCVDYESFKQNVHERGLSYAVSLFPIPKESAIKKMATKIKTFIKSLTRKKRT